MNSHLGRVVGVSIVGLGLLALVISAPAGNLEPTDPGERAAEQLRALTGERLPAAPSAPSGWSEASLQAAQDVSAKYGEPHERSDGALVWHNTGPFRRTIVFKDQIPHRFPRPHYDVVEQSVDYGVPVSRYDDLARFDGSLRPDRTTGQLAARGQSERENILALNLAHELLSGKRTVAGARAAMARLSGTASPYTQILLFKPGVGQPDPDQAAR